MSIFVVIIVPITDGLVPVGDRSSADTMVTNSGFYMFIRERYLKGLHHPKKLPENVTVHFRIRLTERNTYWV